MNNLKAILLVFVSSTCWCIYSEDAISEYIKSYQIAKLQEIAAQNLVMLPADRQRYLDQLDIMKKQMLQLKQEFKDSGFVKSFPDKFVNFQMRLMGKSLAYLGMGVFAAIGAKYAYEAGDNGNPRTIIIVAGATGVSALLLFLGCRKFYRATFNRLPDKLYRKMLIMESLIKTIPGVDSPGTKK